MKQVVLITGGTSRIGLGLAEAFMNQGAAVAVCGRSEAALERFSRAHSDALAIEADVTIGEARIAMLKSVADQFGRPDILINKLAPSSNETSQQTPTPRKTSNRKWLSI